MNIFERMKKMKIIFVMIKKRKLKLYNYMGASKCDTKSS